MIPAFLNVPALLVVTTISFFGWRLSRNHRTAHATPLSSTGDFVQSSSLLVATIWCVKTLCNLEDPSLLGPEIAFVLLCILYGTIVKLALFGYEWACHLMEAS